MANGHWALDRAASPNPVHRGVLLHRGRPPVDVSGWSRAIVLWRIPARRLFTDLMAGSSRVRGNCRDSATTRLGGHCGPRHCGRAADRFESDASRGNVHRGVVRGDAIVALAAISDRDGETVAA